MVVEQAQVEQARVAQVQVAVVVVAQAQAVQLQVAVVVVEQAGVVQARVAVLVVEQAGAVQARDVVSRLGLTVSNLIESFVFVNSIAHQLFVVTSTPQFQLISKVIHCLLQITIILKSWLFALKFLFSCFSLCHVAVW